MNANDFGLWRQQMDITQDRAAAIFGVTRTTIQNWESGSSQIPGAVDAGCEVWGNRLRQENPNIGPVTLIYSNGSMFINPYGPRRAPAMMQQEPYLTTAGALARVQQLWGREDFCNPFIIDETRKPLWNIVELEQAVTGADSGAPTLPNMLRAVAKDIRANSNNSNRFAVRGSNMLTPAEAQERQVAIEAQADALERIAKSGLAAIVRDPQQVETIFAELRRLGTKAPDTLVSAIAHAFVIFERGPLPGDSEPRLEAGGYVMEYRGCVITWPKTPIDAARFTVNVASENPHLLARLGGCLVINDPRSIDNAIAKARRQIDELI